MQNMNNENLTTSIRKTKQKNRSVLTTSKNNNRLYQRPILKPIRRNLGSCTNLPSLSS